MSKQRPEISQLHRLYGQLQAVEKMIDNKAKIFDVLQQIEAVRGSLLSLEKKIMARKIESTRDEELKKIYNYLLKN